ncbi:uncharacterized protein LOC100897740 [Galendromus occidentalis]|uniref:Uncharacterized protein LOC100897740 n=1 Tax=Galendromus occidentalis TaxID=34638 RepID=A0AAJ7SG65_9ACAR|nr:uncharacterized protein LOC100897740 [Galendromus occidentalis]
MSGSSHGEVVIIEEGEMEVVQHEDLPSSKEKKSMLSMLAEVASATLSTPNAKNKTSKMTLEQIKALKPSTLVDLFAIYKTDEAGTKFCFMCRLLPDKCRAAFWSHTGNEVRARQLMQCHLYEHIQEIEKDASIVQVEEGDQVYENSEVIEVIEIAGRQRTTSSSSATLSASEVEDNDQDGEPLFHPRALNPLETGDDWTTLEELSDHFYTHPCGPAEVPREKHVTQEIKFEADGSHNLNPEPPVCISTPPWPSIYTPLLPNISEIENIRAEPIPESSSEEEEEEPEEVSVQYVVEQVPQEQYGTTTKYVYEGNIEDTMQFVKTFHVIPELRQRRSDGPCMRSRCERRALRMPGQ